MAIAATTFMVASIWDGIANFAAGMIVDRHRPQRGFGAVLTVGAIPLGLAFVLAYMPPLAAGYWGIATIFVGHLFFRTAYAAVNVPYLAMSARIARTAGDRAFVAGMRMLFGTLAAITVALGTVPVGEWLTGTAIPPRPPWGRDVVRRIGAAILLLVGARTGKPRRRRPASPFRCEPRWSAWRRTGPS